MHSFHSCCQNQLCSTRYDQVLAIPSCCENSFFPTAEAIRRLICPSECSLSGVLTSWQTPASLTCCATRSTRWINLIQISSRFRQIFIALAASSPALAKTDPHALSGPSVAYSAVSKTCALPTGALPGSHRQGPGTDFCYVTVGWCDDNDGHYQMNVAACCSCLFNSDGLTYSSSNH